MRKNCKPSFRSRYRVTLSEKMLDSTFELYHLLSAPYPYIGQVKVICQGFS
jgi:hypothetical protein